MKVIGKLHFSNRSRSMLPMLVAESAVHLNSDAGNWHWYALQKAGGPIRCRAGDEIYVLEKGVYISFENELRKRTTELTKYRQFSYASGSIIGAIKGDCYAFYDIAKNDLLFEGEDDDGVDELCFYTSDVHVYQQHKRLVACNNQGEKLWEKRFQIADGVGSFKEIYAIPEYNLLIVWYSEQGGYKKLYVLSVKNGETLNGYDLDGGIRLSGFYRDSEKVYIVDYSTIWALQITNGEKISQVELPKIPDSREVAFTQSIIALIYHGGQLVILDKTTLNHLHTLDLGQAQYHCHMTGNKTGVAVRLVDKNAFKGAGAAGYGLYLTDEQLVKGEMPDLTPEPLAASIEKTPAEGGYNLTVTLNAELTVADFLRHLSHALWQSAYEHCTLVDAIDCTNVRLGPPDFMGTLTLNLKNAPELTDEQEQAINAIIEGAKRTMCGLGECIVQANTENQRVLEIKIER